MLVEVGLPAAPADLRVVAGVLGSVTVVRYLRPTLPGGRCRAVRFGICAGMVLLIEVAGLFCGAAPFWFGGE